MIDFKLVVRKVLKVEMPRGKTEGRKGALPDFGLVLAGVKIQ